jgi:hypothetical protein
MMAAAGAALAAAKVEDADALIDPVETFIFDCARGVLTAAPCVCVAAAARSVRLARPRSRGCVRGGR